MAGTRPVLEAALLRPALVLGTVAVGLVASLAVPSVAPQRYRAAAHVLAQWSDPADADHSSIAAELVERRLGAVRQRVLAGAALERARLGVRSAAVSVRTAGNGSFSIESECSDPSKAALLSNRLADRLVEQAERERVEAGVAELEALEARLAGAWQAMEEAKAALVRFRGAAPPASDAVPALERLVREYDEARSSYFEVEGQVTAAEASRSGESGRVRFTVLWAAVPPSAPLSPSLAPLAVVGVVVGLAAGLGLAVLAELRDRSVKGPEDLGEVLPYPLLVEIPLVRVPRSARRARRGSRA